MALRGQGRQRGFQTASTPPGRHTPPPARRSDHTATGKLNGRDDAAHAQRVPGFHHAVARALGGNRQTVELARQAQQSRRCHISALAQATGGILPASNVTRRPRPWRRAALRPAGESVRPARCRHGAPGSEGCVCAANGVAGLRACAGGMGHHFAREGRRTTNRPLVSRRGHAQALQRGMDFRNDAGSNRGVRHGNQPVRVFNEKHGAGGPTAQVPGKSISAARWCHYPPCRAGRIAKWNNFIPNQNEVPQNGYKFRSSLALNRESVAHQMTTRRAASSFPISINPSAAPPCSARPFAADCRLAGL